MSISKNTQKKIFSKESITSIILVVIVFILDRVSKTTIINSQEKNQSTYINDYLNFDLVWNTGISFGLLSQNANLYYHLITLLIFTIIIFLIYLITKADFMEKILFSLILGGAIGNFYDRLFYFAVPDFIDFHIDNYHWFTFNIADIFISIGIILIIIKDLILKKK
jgi:signal peptidase II